MPKKRNYFTTNNFHTKISNGEFSPDHGTINPNTTQDYHDLLFNLCLVVDCKQLRSNLSITCNVHYIRSKGQLCQIQYLLYHYQSFSLPRSGQRGRHKFFPLTMTPPLHYHKISPEMIPLLFVLQKKQIQVIMHIWTCVHLSYYHMHTATIYIYIYNVHIHTICVCTFLYMCVHMIFILQKHIGVEYPYLY